MVNNSSLPIFQFSTIPVFQFFGYAIIPVFHYSNIPFSRGADYDPSTTQNSKEG
jgi:hypothetical protein